MKNVKELFDLTGKVALVTGGSRGLGLQMATAFGDLGAKVAITARKAADLKEAEAHLKARGIEVLAVVSDLGRLADQPWVALVDQVLARFKAIDILVNNAGTVWGEPAESHSAEGWNKVMDLNVSALFFLSQEVARRSMIPRKAGKIINTASIAGLIGNAPGSETYTIAYNASKGAVISFTRALAAEWGRYNINVNAICPGYFPTKLARGLDRIADQIRKGTPIGRTGGEHDMMGPALFLASEASRHVTGHALPVDGGVTIV